MTIVEAIKEILAQYPSGLPSDAIYTLIVSNNLYTFKAQNPKAVVNGEIRRRCEGLDFPTASPVKLFRIISYQDKKPCFGLLDTPLSTIALATVDPVTSTSGQLPEERISTALQAYYAALKQQIVERIMANPPGFFENLVMDLLLKMGYGHDTGSGTVTGRSHDGGIDVIISEDKLGLDQIYVQAKRYASHNHIGRKELQAFVGAMVSVHKGVFITTSSFTKEAAAFIAQQQQKSIRLIDGKLLADLIVRYEVGLNTVESFSLYRIDSDYYGTD